MLILCLSLDRVHRESTVLPAISYVMENIDRSWQFIEQRQAIIELLIDSIR